VSSAGAADDAPRRRIVAPVTAVVVNVGVLVWSIVESFRHSLPQPDRTFAAGVLTLDAVFSAISIFAVIGIRRGRQDAAVAISYYLAITWAALMVSAALNVYVFRRAA